MTRALLVVLDSVGIGGAPDAAAYGDAGADTVGHIADACAAGRGDRPGLRAGPLSLPNLAALGLGLACKIATGQVPPGLALPGPPAGRWGVGTETSRGKDTPSGHWEIAGVPVVFDWGYFPDADPAFPAALTDALIREGGLPGILGNRHASGTAVIDELGAEHVRTGKPICYTSVDSVFQIAAHEEAFGLQRLYDLCALARRLCDPYRIGRVIARPFVGNDTAGFRRTPRRKDFATPPPADTILDRLSEAGRAVVSVGKIGDIFAHRGTGTEVKPEAVTAPPPSPLRGGVRGGGRAGEGATVESSSSRPPPLSPPRLGEGNASVAPGNEACLTAALEAFRDLPDGGLVFVNLVDFDSEFGHRRDVAGYAAALEAFDWCVPEVRAALGPGDLCVVTADHGNDPTFRGTDHTRESVPILVFGPGVEPGSIGRRDSLADIGATILRHLGLPALPAGRLF